MIRQKTSATRECALPQKNDATTKIAIDPRSSAAARRTPTASRDRQ